MRPFPWPGWILGVSAPAFVITWLMAPHTSGSGLTADPGSALPVRRAPPPRNALLELTESAAPPIAPAPPFFVLGHPFKVALTFDDGPHPRYTARLLDVLQRHAVSATFFVNGRYLVDGDPNAAANREVLRRAQREGHLIGNHTFNHVNLAALSREDQTREIVANEELLTALLGERPRVFRPPYALLSRHSLALLRQRGYVVARWNAAVPDEETRSPEEIARDLLLWLRHHEGGISMLHDRHWTAVEATERVLTALERENCDRAATAAPTIQVVALDAFFPRPAQSLASVDSDERERASHLTRLRQRCRTASTAAR